MCSTFTWSNPTVRQTWVVFPILLSKISFGMALGFATVFLSAIQQPHSTITMDINTSSWFVSALGMALLVGYVVTPCLMSACGRRRGYMWNCLPAALALLVLALSEHVIALLLSRVLIGISLGGVGITAGMLVAEYTSPRNRGMFLTLSTACLNLGILIVHILGICLSWRTLAIIIPLPLSISAVIIYTCPESPSWLAARNQYERSREAFYWLRGRTEETTKEIEELIRAQNHNTTEKPITNHCTSIIRKFKKRNFWKPLIITALCGVLLETSGRYIIPSYAVQLTQEMTSSDTTALYFTSLVDVLIVASGVVASYLITVLNVRTLLFTSALATVVSLCLLSATFFMFSSGVLPAHYSWVSLLMFGVYCVLTNLGCTCIPLTLLGEIFPLEHRGVGCVMIGIIVSIVTTVALKIMPYVLAACNAHGAYGILAAALALNVIPFYFVLPETKNRTLQEIEDYYNYGTFKVCKETAPIDGDETRSLKSSKSNDVC